MSQHTPGPWRQNGDVIFDANFRPIVCRGAYAPESKGERIDSDRWMVGNARLIAKVPEMRRELDPMWFLALANRISEYLADPSDNTALIAFMEESFERANRQRTLIKEIEG